VNAWQSIRQTQYLTRKRKWTGSANVVFASASVVIAAGSTEELAEKLRMPAAIFRPGGLTVDPDFPDYVDQELIVRLVVTQAGDATGEFAIVGGHRTSQTRSQGRGILEIEEELFAAIELLGTDSGIVVLHKASSAMNLEYVAGQYLIFRDYVFSLRTTADRFYHPVINLQES